MKTNSWTTAGQAKDISSNPTVVCSTDRSKAVVPVLVLLFVALWFILRGDLLYVFPCVILFLCFSVLLVLRLPRLGKRELILVLFVRLFGLCLFRFVGFLFLLVSGLRFVIVALSGLFSYLFYTKFPTRPPRRVSFLCNMCSVCRSLFTFPLGVTGRLLSVILALSGHLHYFAII